MKSVHFKTLGQTQKKLVAAAEAAASTSYSPYSGFAVGAALQTAGGKIITGSNVENAAYGLTICAEQAALVRANAMGHREFRAIAVVAKGRGQARATITAPCGACRQMLFEAAWNADRDIAVILCSPDRKTVVLTSIAELLPLAFSPKKNG